MPPVREMPVTLDADKVANIEGTTTKVIEIVEAKQAHELTPEEVARELPHLTQAQVYGALAYYHAHKSEIDMQIESRHRFGDSARTDRPNSFTRAELQARQSQR